jgi:predicted PurR-regulated permease PerM
MDRALFKTILACGGAVLFLYLLYAILSPFLSLMIWAGALGSVTYPLYQRLLSRCRQQEIICAALMTTAVTLALVLPMIGLMVALSHEVAVAYHYLERLTAGNDGLTLERLLQHPALAPVLERLQPLIGPINLELDSILLPTVKQGLSVMLNYSTGIVKNLLNFVLKMVLLVITLFFIYKDGAYFMQRCWQLLEFSPQLQDRIVDTVGRVLRAVMYGVILTCMVQGTLGGLGFWVTGLPSPLLFGTLMAFCAPIPFVGTALIWLPGVVYLLAQGQTAAGVGLAIWGALMVSSIDNVLRPLFISTNAKLPILLIVFGVLGGFLAFGLSGVVAGPLVLALVLVLLDAYRADSILPPAQSTDSDS